MKRRSYLRTVGGAGASLAGASALVGTAAASDAYETMILRVWRDDNASFESDWDGRIDTMLGYMEEYLIGEVSTVNQVLTNSQYGSTAIQVDDPDSESDMKAAIPDYAQEKGNINLVIIDEQTEYLGRKLTEVDDSAGGICYQNLTLPQWFVDAVDVPERYRIPNMMHEVFHCVGAEHKHGRPNADYLGASPTIMATGYTFIGADAPAAGVDCDGNDWEQSFNLPDPQEKITECTDEAVKAKLGDGSDGSPYSW